MLSIGEVCARNAGYYVSLARVDDYYRDNAEPGRWWGSGVRGLGIELDESVGSDGFHALLEGFHPESGEPLVQNAGDFTSKRARRAGHDLCFSPPKSVSILFAASDDAARAVILAAHQKAVNAALARIEEQAAWTRTGHKGTNLIRSRGLLVAQFDHFTSREGDPQIHTHSVVLNLAEADERWRALDTRGLFTQGRKLEWGRLYRDSLRDELGRELGLSFRDTPEKGARTWEVHGIPQSILDDHSKRRAQILERGYGSAAEASRVALKTRAPKLESPKTRAELFAAWRQDLQHRFPDVLHLERLQALPHPEHSSDRHQPAREPSCASEKLPGRAQDPRPKERARESGGGEVIASLEQAVALLRDAVKTTKHAFAPRPSRIHAALWSTRYGLDKGQRAAVRDVVRGSGATHLYRNLEDRSLVALAKTYERSGFRFYSLSLTKDRASDLRCAGVNRTMTIAGAMTVLNKSLLEKHWSLNGLASAFWRPPHHIFPRVMNRGGAWPDSKSVLFVETTNYPDPSELAELRALAQRSDARVVFAGDATIDPCTKNEPCRLSISRKQREEEKELAHAREQQLTRGV